MHISNCKPSYQLQEGKKSVLNQQKSAQSRISAGNG